MDKGTSNTFVWLEETQHGLDIVVLSGLSGHSEVAPLSFSVPVYCPRSAGLNPERGVRDTKVRIHTFVQWKLLLFCVVIASNEAGPAVDFTARLKWVVAKTPGNPVEPQFRNRRTKNVVAHLFTLESERE